MFRLIIFTLIGLFAVVMLRTTPEIATGRHTSMAEGQPGGAQIANGARGVAPVGAPVDGTSVDGLPVDGARAAAAPDRDPARLAFDRIGAAVERGTTAPQGGVGVGSPGADAGSTGQWIEIRDAAGRRGFISTRNAALAAQ